MAAPPGAASTGGSCVSHATSGRCTGRRVRVERGGRLDAPVGQVRRDHALDVEDLRVRVLDAALAGEPDEAAEDLPAHLLTGVAGSRCWGSADSANGTSTLFVHEESARSCPLSGDEPLVELHEPGHRLPQVGRQSLQLRRTHQRPRLLDPWDAHVERRGGGAHPRERLAGEHAQRRQGGVQVAERRVAGASVSRSAGTDASSAASWLASAPATTSRSVTRSFSSSGRLASAPKVRAWPRSSRAGPGSAARRAALRSSAPSGGRPGLK